MQAATVAFLNQVPEEIQQEIGEIFKQILQSDFGDHALSVGDKAKTFTLSNASDQRTSLAALTANPR